MQFNIERSVLLRSLTHVQGVVERRTTIPILSNVLLQANSGKIGLTATDMDIAIIEGIPEVALELSITFIFSFGTEYNFLFLKILTGR